MYPKIKFHLLSREIGGRIKSELTQKPPNPSALPRIKVRPQSKDFGSVRKNKIMTVLKYPYKKVKKTKDVVILN